jgi:hypothetical protein
MGVTTVQWLLFSQGCWLGLSPRNTIAKIQKLQKSSYNALYFPHTEVDANIFISWRAVVFLQTFGK